MDKWYAIIYLLRRRLQIHLEKAVDYGLLDVDSYQFYHDLSLYKK